jgi:hypothetical protein
MKKTATIPRNSYGEVIGSQAALLFETTYPRALDIIKQAAKQKLIPASYDCITWDHKRRADGEALHHELYDFAAGKVLVCLRRSQGNGKYGVSTTSKQYIILTRSNGKISVIEADKNRAAKLAKSDLPAGGVIAALTGAKPAKIKPLPEPKPRPATNCSPATRPGNWSAFGTGQHGRSNKLAANAPLKTIMADFITTHPCKNVWTPHGTTTPLGIAGITKTLLLPRSRPMACIMSTGPHTEQNSAQPA